MAQEVDAEPPRFSVDVRRQLIFWLLALVVFLGLLYLLRAMLLPFLAGMVLAYFLDPVADKLEAWGIGRAVATSLILLAFIFLFVMALLVIVPVLGEQIAGFAERLPGYVAALQAIVAENEFLNRIRQADGSQALRDNLDSVMQQGAKWTSALLTSIWSSGMALVGIASLLVITPIVAFYMLLDWDRMVARIDDYLPRDHKQTIRQLAKDMDTAVAGFVRGQGSVCLALGVFYALALTLIGLNFGLLIGIFAGLISFIPFVGSIAGLVLSVGVAIVQFWPEWWMVLMVIAIFSFGQFVEGNFLQPRWVGKSIGIHPVWLMFALAAFGSLLGFVGLLIAVPVTAAIGVLVRFALDRYRDSALYNGQAADAGDE